MASLQLDRNGEPRLIALPKRHPQHTRIVQVRWGASEGFRQPLRGIFSRFGVAEWVGVRFPTEQIQNPLVRGTGVFLLRSGSKPLWQGGTITFFCLKEKGRKRSWRACSSTAMASRSFLLCRKDIRNTRGKYRFKGCADRIAALLRGIFFHRVRVSQIFFDFARSRVVPLFDFGFPKSMISSPSGGGGVVCVPAGLCRQTRICAYFVNADTHGGDTPAACGGCLPSDSPSVFILCFLF